MAIPSRAASSQWLSPTRRFSGAPHFRPTSFTGGSNLLGPRQKTKTHFRAHDLYVSYTGSFGQMLALASVFPVKVQLLLALEAQRACSAIARAG